MKKLIIILIAFSLFLVSSYAIASVHGTWNVDRIEKSILKIGKAKPVTEIVNIPDVWLFKDDNSCESAFFSGVWTQKGASFTVTVAYEQMKAFIESQFLSRGMPVSATIKKLRIYGSEKKDWTIKGKYEIKADLVYPDLTIGKLDIKGSFIGIPPYDTSEYFPLGQGDTWTIRSIEQEGAEIDEDIDTWVILGTEKIRGLLAAKRIEGDDGDYELITNTKGIQFYKDYEIDIEDGSAIEESIDTYNPPIMYVPPRVSVGSRHSFKSTLTHKETSGFKVTAKISGEMIVEGMEDVTVPAGSFQDCLRIKITRHLVAPKVKHEESSETTIWLAKGVGMVKEMGSDVEITEGQVEEESSYTDELISATVGGINYP